MATRVGLLGFGKIGHALARHVLETGNQLSFIQDPVAEADPAIAAPLVREADASLLQQTDLVVECANRFALAENFDAIIQQADLMVFSLTAFSDQAFLDHAREAANAAGHHIYVPHGAILGLDGIRDGRAAIDSVSIVTTKNPKSLGLNPEDYAEKAVVFEGSTRDACSAFPRNVNVHAACALAGIGFDKTHSTIVADPAVHTNSHLITVKGQGIEFELHVSSFTTGGVTGVYTPLSAQGSLDRVLRAGGEFMFV